MAATECVLVTGGAGFIGSHFIEWLLQESDAQVVCFDRLAGSEADRLRSNLESFAGNPRVAIERADFRKLADVDSVFARYKITSVVHLGALTGVRQSVRHPLAYERTNVRGTLNLFEAARRASINRFVYVSSSSVYGPDATLPFREEGVACPISPYGATKLAAETLAQTYHRLHGLPVVCIRPFSVYGRRLRPDLALSIITRGILAGEEIRLFGDGSVQRDFTHVADVCRGLLEAWRRPSVDGKTVNLGSGCPVSLWNLIGTIEWATGRKAQVRTAPARKEDLTVTWACTALAEQLLGFRPCVSLEEGIQDYITWLGRSLTHRTVDAGQIASPDLTSSEAGGRKDIAEKPVTN